MPTKGQKITNSQTGDTYEFLETAEDTSGKQVAMKATIKSKGPLVPDHIHAFQDEVFEVISGQLTIRKSGKTSVLSAGEKATLPKNTPHNHYNDNNEDVIYKHIVRPALDFDYLMENLIGQIADSKGKKGSSGFVQQLVSLKYLNSKTYMAGVPIGMQKFLANIVAPVGKLLGYRAIYEKFSGKEKR